LRGKIKVMGNENIIAEFYENIKLVLTMITYADAKAVLLGSKKISEFTNGLDKFLVNVAKGMTDKYISLYKGFILNHTTFKLSDLDLEMIKPVPQGGSWKDIPEETVKKSKRLERITRTGGRTTLYGRIDYSKPSYTITTYFNRPGNGTYVHPVHERVISVREAARFQTFPDDYYFFGNKTQLLKQVGNAVPTILAYQIGKTIYEKTGCSKSIDLFCGAGGMTAGFKAAGIHSLLSNDIEESACTTLKINNPEIPVLCGDITSNEVKAAIEKAAKAGGADIISGGPPCQGFSLAGFRSEDDPRNQLFREFVDVVQRVNPKVIVFENVEGLLSYQRGNTYREVHKLFGALGYHTEGRTLMANAYAVPQKRKRVIIICTRKDMNISPSELYPTEMTSAEKTQVTAQETIGDLEMVECSLEAKYMACNESNILKFFKREISYDEYISGYISAKMDTEQSVNKK
jgi:DNA (cytosine-5)-methyltransferase 1